MNLLYIHWNPDPVLFHIGNFGLRWYSIFWMIAILAACQVVYKLYQVKKLPIDTYQSLFVYCMVGVFVGARLGHCLFYDPSYFLAHPLEIVLPVRFLPNGEWIFTGYAGLASHGGTLGLIIALYLFCRWYADHIALGICLRASRPPAPASGSALRSACLFPVLRHHGLDIPEAERHCPQRLLFRALHRLDIHFPFLHRVSQRTSSRVRERYAYRHGAGVEHSFHPAGALFRIPKRKNQNIIRAQQKSH